KEIYSLHAVSPVVIPKPSYKEIEADHDHMATEFLTGVRWSYNYMLTGTGPDWYYKPSVLPPLLVDIARVLSKGVDPSRSLLTMPEWKPLELSVYLLTILPEKSAKDLVDSRLHQAFLLESGLMDLFPLTFEIFGPGEIKEGAAKGILPPLGLDRLTKWVREHI